MSVAELEAGVAVFDPASDPLLPEEPVASAVPSPAADAESRRAGISLRDLAGDDRDIIVVEENAPRRHPPPHLLRHPNAANIASSSAP